MVEVERERPPLEGVLFAIRARVVQRLLQSLREDVRVVSRALGSFSLRGAQGFRELAQDDPPRVAAGGGGFGGLLGGSLGALLCGGGGEGSSSLSSSLEPLRLLDVAALVPTAAPLSGQLTSMLSIASYRLMSSFSFVSV